ncbi:MAG: esterase family protein [Trueperaceae bacterium]|nr:esterase family protein [Trueperaceae bacterium]
MQLKITQAPWARELISDSTDMDRAPLKLEPGAAPLTLELPDDVYYEYAFVDDAGQVRPDPQWPHVTKSIWYGTVNEVKGPAYRPDPLADVPAERATGALERLRLQSEALDGTVRRAALYTPVGLDGAELPLVVVQDGVTFMRVGRIAAVQEELLARGAARPARILMIEPIDRLVEYAFNDSYNAFVLEELLPHVTALHPTAPRRVWLGASLGAQASAYLHAQTMGEEDVVVALSGAFLGAHGDHDHYRSSRSWLREWLAERAAVPGRWFLDVGSLEWLHDINLEVAAALQSKGADVSLNVRSAGHNWVAWRDALPAALRFALRS